MENFGYRQLISLFGLSGLIGYRKYSKSWGRIQRTRDVYKRQHPAIALLARLEHERWCGFLYAHGYQGRDGNTRNDLFHPCLVDWEALLRDDETCKTVCYDLIPILLMDP